MPEDWKHSKLILCTLSFQSPAAYIKGTVNDPTTYPEPNAAHGSYHWSVERGLSVALIPIIAAGVAKHGTSAVLDGVLALTLVAHSHIGFACCLDDYVHKRKFPIAGPVSSLLLKLATAGTLYGLYGEYIRQDRTV